MTASSAAPKLVTMLMDEATPRDQRVEMLLNFASQDPVNCQPVLDQLLRDAASKNQKGQYTAKLAELKKLMAELQRLSLIHI